MSEYFLSLPPLYWKLFEIKSRDILELRIYKSTTKQICLTEVLFSPLRIVQFSYEKSIPLRIVFFQIKDG